MFRLHLLVAALDLPWLLDIADDLDDGSYWAADGEDFQEQLAQRYPASETFHDE